MSHRDAGSTAERRVRASFDKAVERTTKRTRSRPGEMPTDTPTTPTTPTNSSTSGAALSKALTVARVTALPKMDAFVRGVATGCPLRRLAVIILTKQFAQMCSAPTRVIHQDSFSHMLLAVTDTNPDATMRRVDGVGAHDHVLRAAMLGRQARMRRASAFLFFVLKSCSEVSTHKMVRRRGQRHWLEEENMATFRCRCCSPSEFRARRGSVSVVTAFLDDVFFGGGAWEDEALVRSEGLQRHGTEVAVLEFVATGTCCWRMRSSGRHTRRSRSRKNNGCGHHPICFSFAVRMENCGPWRQPSSQPPSPVVPGERSRAWNTAKALLLVILWMEELRDAELVTTLPARAWEASD